MITPQRIVIASAAKQTRAALHRPGLHRRFAPRNDEVVQGKPIML